ncbi:MAG: hypothetical protein R2692_00485 [Microbacterium sp.]
MWRDGNLAAGRRLVGRKIGLTSKAMQQATGITEPDYGVMFEDTVYATGSTIDAPQFSNVRIGGRARAFVLTPLEGLDRTLDVLAAIDYAGAGPQVLNLHIELEGARSSTRSATTRLRRDGARRRAPPARRDRPAL